MSGLMDSGANYLIVEGGTFRRNINKPLSVGSFSERAIKIKFRWRVTVSCFRPKTYFLSGYALANHPKPTPMTSLLKGKQTALKFGKTDRKRLKKWDGEEESHMPKTLDNVGLLYTSLRQESTNCLSVSEKIKTRQGTSGVSDMTTPTDFRETDCSVMSFPIIHASLRLQDTVSTYPHFPFKSYGSGFMLLCLPGTARAEGHV